MYKLIAALALTVAAPAFAADPAPAPAEAAVYSTAGSTLGVLLDNAATKAVLEKHIPKLVANPQLAMARGITLKQTQGMAGDALSDDLLARIDADLAAIKAK